MTNWVYKYNYMVLSYLSSCIYNIFINLACFCSFLLILACYLITISAKKCKIKMSKEENGVKSVPATVSPINYCLIANIHKRDFICKYNNNSK